ncbi:MAG: SLATT domain-containing protein [Symploca sp. SIO2C1]|nr:SLATT domain-containing protein [Symploca sp. SIO2C1]
MPNQVDSDRSFALETAWQSYAQLKTKASEVFRLYQNLRLQAIAFSLLAILLAVIVSTESDLITILMEKVLTVSLVSIPIVTLVIFAITSKFQQGQYWQILNAGAEEIRKEIYLYRTLLLGQESRHQWLNERVTAIQCQVMESIGGNLVLKPYTGPIPPEPEESDSDSGFADLLADDYLHYRLQAQQQASSQELNKLHTTRTRLQIGIFLLGGISAFLPVLSISYSIWVAFTLALAIALTLWLELCRLDERINQYNQLILSLNIIRDRWKSLTPQERTGDEFFQLVLATEKVLSSQHNPTVGQMRQAVAQLQNPTSDLLVEILDKPAPEVINRALLPQPQTEAEILTAEVEIISETTTHLEEVQPIKEEQEKNIKKGLPHAFVVMPFGRKQGRDGLWIDFNSIYQNLIKPALEEAGFEPFRADEESVSGDILTDMFQELLLADLVLTDLSIDNANVFYELGVRHALRKRGLVHIQCGRAYLPYDIFNVRALPYHCDDNGCPDPQYLEKDKQAIIKMIRATWESDENRIHSPIFQLLTGLSEPDRKALQTPLATGYWLEYQKWQERIHIAERQKRIGDVLLLTEEVTNPLIKCEAIAEAGKSLKNLGNSALALKEYRQGLKIESSNIEFRREEAFHLAKLRQFDEAIVKLEALLQDEPNDIEALSYLADIYKEVWLNEWTYIADEQERLKTAYESAHLLKKSIETFLKAYRLNQIDYKSGIRTLVLLAVLEHLSHQFETDTDPEEDALRQQLPLLKGSIQFGLESAIKKDENDFWAFVSLGHLVICTASDPKQVTRAYKKALTLLWKNKFALQTTLTQLKLLEALKFRLDYVQAGIAILQEELNRIIRQEEVTASATDREPSQVILFSGHMIDSPTRPKPRFPADMEDEAHQKIKEVLKKLNTDSDALAIVPGIACGGDILFIEDCLLRNIKVEIFLPFEPAQFIIDSVSFAGDNWVKRFYTIQNHPNVKINLQLERLGKVPEGDNPYERNNRWALYSTLMYGIEKVSLVVLWNGQGGDAPGGTGDMVQQVRQFGGVVEHIDTTKFDYWKTLTSSQS